MEHNKYTQDHVDGLSGPKAWFTKFCNTFGIVNNALGAGNAAGYWDGHPGYRTQFADVALDGAATFVGCTSAFTTGFGVRAVRAYVWLKNYRRGVATAASAYKGMRMELQVAIGVSTFTALSTTTGTAVIDVRDLPRATCAMLLSGIIPNNEQVSAARLAVYPTVNAAGTVELTDTASFDCNIDAVPGS